MGHSGALVAHGAAERVVTCVILSGLLAPCSIAVPVNDGLYVRQWTVQCFLLTENWQETMQPSLCCWLITYHFCNEIYVL